MPNYCICLEYRECYNWRGEWRNWSTAFRVYSSRQSRRGRIDVWNFSIGPCTPCVRRLLRRRLRVISFGTLRFVRTGRKWATAVSAKSWERFAGGRPRTNTRAACSETCRVGIPRTGGGGERSSNESGGYFARGAYYDKWRRCD